ncbi:MAG: PadR family transcriptional regulator [Propioniciclava sp.]
MNRDPRLPLTETVFYVLLALREPAHGYLIMTRVGELSGGQVALAAGTLYGALENLLKQGLIARLHSDDPRRKVYQINPLGLHVLDLDVQRMRHMVQAAESTLREGGSDA